MIKNTVILPVRNEPSINDFIEDLCFELDSLMDPFEVIVVRGDKETLNNCLNPNVWVHEFKSYGDSLERAILFGFGVARGENILVMDADGSHPVDMVPYFFRALGGCDFVAGSRFVDGGECDMSLFRVFVSQCYRFYARLLGSRLSDPMTGFFAFKRGLLDGVSFKPVVWKTGFELEYKSKPRLVELPIIFGKRKAGVSKTSSILGLRLIGDMLVTRFD